jgi:hypothetical protein
VTDSPLVPAEIVLRDFTFMPLDVVRLRDSDLASKTSGEEFRAAVLLWCVAWHQVPAASLPSDDESLAKFAGFGKRNRVGYDKAGWAKVREGALRGFKLCSDGRLYHPVIAEKAREAWDGKLHTRFKRECERIKKAAQRADTVPCYPSFDEWKEHLALTGEDRWSGLSQGTQQGRPSNVYRESHSLKGQGEGERQGQGEEKPNASGSFNLEASTQVPTSADDATRACVMMEQAGCKSTNPSRAELIAALAEGVTPEVLADTAREGATAGKTNPFAWAIKTARARRAEGAKPINGAKAVKPATPSEAVIVKRTPADPERVAGFWQSAAALIGIKP